MLPIVALCLSLGLHWLALQSVAWTTMLVANARHVPLSEAVARTFDGSHPCDLCHVVTEGKKSEKKSEILPRIAKMDLICVTRSLLWPPPWVRCDYGPRALFLPETSLVPPINHYLWLNAGATRSVLGPDWPKRSSGRHFLP